jgi:hypothetical protein
MRRPHIPLAVRWSIWVLPCVICQSRKDVCIDHIIPVAQGGTNADAAIAQKAVAR